VLYIQRHLLFVGVKSRNADGCFTLFPVIRGDSHSESLTAVTLTVLLGPN